MIRYIMIYANWAESATTWTVDNLWIPSAIVIVMAWGIFYGYGRARGWKVQGDDLDWMVIFALVAGCTVPLIPPVVMFLGPPVFCGYLAYRVGRRLAGPVSPS